MSRARLAPAPPGLCGKSLSRPSVLRCPAAASYRHFSKASKPAPGLRSPQAPAPQPRSPRPRSAARPGKPLWGRFAPCFSIGVRSHVCLYIYMFSLNSGTCSVPRASGAGQAGPGLPGAGGGLRALRPARALGARSGRRGPGEDPSARSLRSGSRMGSVLPRPAGLHGPGGAPASRRRSGSADRSGPQGLRLGYLAKELVFFVLFFF